MTPDPERPQPAPQSGLPANRAWSEAPVFVASAWDRDSRRTTFFELANVLLQRWRLVILTPIVAGVLAAIAVLVVSPRYTAITTFVPETKKSGMNLPGIAGLAAEFGVGIPGMDNSSRFYAEVLESRSLRDSVLLTRLPDPRRAGDSARVLDILEVRGRDSAESLENGRVVLNSIVKVGVDGTTNVVTIAVKTYWPLVSAHVATRYIALLNQFNNHQRQTGGRVKREFAEARVTQAEAELRAAEDDLVRFQGRNRQFERSPELNSEYGRLQREIRVKESVLSTLRSQYEEARIQEVDDTPLITVIDRADPPGKKSSPKRTLTVILVTLLALFAGVLAAFMSHYLGTARREDAENFRETLDNLAAIRSFLRRLVRGRPA
ncbi:MAG: hypothetical protein EXR93_00265 [Gemmatimonadetes bacterium]|nr:hypothetical protein [Gemmatimonadota bacterium]